MPADRPTILATSGGLFTPDRGDLAFGALLRYAVELAGPTGMPRICQLATASGDQRFHNARFAEAAAQAGCLGTNLNLFPMPTFDDVEAHLMDQDVIWVHGGSVVNLLAVWRAHGLDEILRRVWQSGVVLAGISAGSLCWYRGGTTDSYGPELRPVTNGLGFLPYANGVHYDVEPGRRPLIHRLVADEVLPTAHCTDDGVGLLYHGTELVEAVAENDHGRAYRVFRDAEGHAVEEQLETRRLPG